MTRLSDPVSLWTKAHLELLIAQMEPEGQRLEFKRELSLEKPKQRIEAAKDLTGFANADGGRLIFGIAEGDTPDGFKVPVKIEPLRDGGLSDRLQDSITGICQPRPSYTPHRIDVDGGYCLIIEIPMASPPIMVAAGDRENRYYRRYNTQVLAMGEREVREAYERLAASRGAVDRLLAEADPLDDLPDTEQRFYREADWRRLPVWFSLLFVPSLAPPVLFDPAKLGSVDLGAIDARWASKPLSPTADGLDASFGDLHGLTFEWIRVHRNGVIQCATLPVGQRDYYARRHLGPLSTLWAGEEVVHLARSFAIAGALYQWAGYFGPLTVRSEVRHLIDLTVVERENLVVGSASADEARFETRTSADALVASRREHLQGLFDRIAQATGRPRSEAVDANLD